MSLSTRGDRQPWKMQETSLLAHSLILTPAACLSPCTGVCVYVCPHMCVCVCECAGVSVLEHQRKLRVSVHCMLLR